MGRTLTVAAGGGGDAIAAAMLAQQDHPDEVPCVATYSWDRLIYDPVPGPRAAADFIGLRTHAPDIHEILPTTTPHPPARSTIPRLAAELPARFFLLDPTHGARGMARQLTAIADHANADTLTLVDVGGDLIARGDEPELRSPLADALALTACHLSGMDFIAWICGPGLDGELTEDQVLHRCHDLGAHRLTDLERDQAQRYQRLFRWHPSEATGLFTAAAKGRRGVVEVRDAGNQVRLTDHGKSRFAVDGSRLADGNALVDALLRTRTLGEAETALLRACGKNELDYERAKARKAQGRAAEAVPMSALAEQTAQARDRGADYLTIRRLAELLSMRDYLAADLVSILHSHDEDRCDPPLWAISSPGHLS